MTVKIKTDGKAGQKITKKVTVFTNDPKNAKIELTITGKVISAADIEPKAVRLMGKPGEPLEVNVRIIPLAINEFDITGVKAQEGKYIRFQLEKINNPAFRSFVLHVSNTKPDPGRYYDIITLATTSKVSPELKIRVFGIIR